jgi:ribosomal protein S2
VEYPIAGNDDAIRSVRVIMTTISQTITRARAEYEAKYGRRSKSEQTEKFESAEAVEIAAGDDPSTPESSPA